MKKDGTYTLLELNKAVKSSIKNTFVKAVWVVAEINKLNYHHRSGHCYLELVQKAHDSDQVIASSKGVIWSSVFINLRNYFESTTGAEFSEDIKVLVKVSVEFHEVYGLALNIRDIDPSYTLGDIAKKRKETIDRLKSDNVIDMNKQLVLDEPIKKIAVISSETAAGYEDFVNQLVNNSYNYKYQVKLFQADMQGKNTEDSVLEAFDKIFEDDNLYDVVAVIRGGGSKTDLSVFDNYNIAFHITQFPIPVLTGIGHERDDTVTDIVAYKKLKTPTALANFIIEDTLKHENIVNDFANEIVEKTKDIFYINNLILTQAGVNLSKLRKTITIKRDECNNIAFRLKHIVNGYISTQHSRIELLNNKKHFLTKDLVSLRKNQLYNFKNQLHKESKNILRNKKISIDGFEQNIRYLDPKNVLKRGYTITKSKGKILLDSKNIDVGSEIETVFIDNKVKSKVIKKNK